MLPGLSARGKNVASSCSVEKGCQRMMRLIAWERREFLTWLLAVPDRTERERERGIIVPLVFSSCPMKVDRCFCSNLWILIWRIFCLIVSFTLGSL